MHERPSQDGYPFPDRDTAARYAVPEIGAPLSAPASPAGRRVAGLWDWPDMPLKDRFIAYGLGLVALIVIGATWGGYGHSWDEAYYYDPAVRVQGWLAQMVTAGPKPVDAASIDATWGGSAVPDGDLINELPALPKIAWALGLTGFDKLLGPSGAMRAPVALAFAALLYLIYRFAHALGGRRAALAAVLLFATLPRSWAEAHLAVAETFSALFFLLTVYAFARSMNARRWALIAGLAFGLALNTKIQAVLLPVILIPWAWLYARPRMGDGVMALLFLGPLVAVATWPWLWPDPVGRMLAFLDFYAGHQMTGVFYFGRRWNLGAPPCPWHYPWVMTALTVPPLTLVTVLGGLGLALARRRRAPALALLAMTALFPLVFNSLPGQPKYDGVRLFGWAFPCLAILGGVWLSLAARRLLQAGRPRWLVAGAYGAPLAAGMVAIALSEPHGLSYFNAFIGGTAGAERRGMEVAYWGEALNGSVLDDLNTFLPEDARVTTRALHLRALMHQIEWGRLRSDIQLVDSGQEADFSLVQNRKGFWTAVDHQLWHRYSSGMAGGYMTWDHGRTPLLILYDLRGLGGAGGGAAPGSVNPVGVGQ